jgi:ABC-type sugar transport system ATPase subunit
MVPADNVRSSVAARMGYVPAERRSEALMLDASVSRNLTMAMVPQLSRRGLVKRKTERSLVNHWVERLQIAGTPNTPVRHLSGGSQQKVVLARWLAAGVSILVLVEPTRGVDIATKAEIYRTLRNLSDEGTSVLVISSDLEEVSLIGERVVVLRSGRVAADLPMASEELIAHHAL